MRQAQIVALNKEPVAGLPTDVLMQKFKDRPITLTLQIAPENVPSTMLTLVEKDPGGVESRVWDQTEGLGSLLNAAFHMDPLPFLASQPA